MECSRRVWKNFSEDSKMPLRIQTGVTPAPRDPIAEKKRRRQIIFRVSLGVVLVLACFGLMLRLWAFEGTLITSGSMEPTLLKYDYVLLDHRVILQDTWKRGDVVVFNSPAKWDSAGQTLVKRVIGLPGETVQMRAGIYRINNRPLVENYTQNTEKDDNTLPVTLKMNEYWVSGDNRNNSDDSRVNGPIEGADIRGRISGVLWPPGNIGLIPAPNYRFKTEPDF